MEKDIQEIKKRISALERRLGDGVIEELLKIINDLHKRVKKLEKG